LRLCEHPSVKRHRDQKHDNRTTYLPSESSEHVPPPVANDVPTARTEN
jgi:hypothetical protein